MEQFNAYHEQGLQCSIDFGGSAVPFGAREYFEKYGYIIIKNLWDPKALYDPIPKRNKDTKIKREQTSKYKFLQAKIRKILEDILGETLYSDICYDCFYFERHRVDEHSNEDENKVIVSIQASTNLDSPWPFYIETSNGECHSIDLEDGWAILYNTSMTWRESFKSNLNIFQKLFSKRDELYCHQIYYHYLKT